MPTTTWLNMRARIARGFGYLSVKTTGNHIEVNTVTSANLIPLFPNLDLLKDWFLEVQQGTELGKVRLITTSSTAGVLTTSNPAFTVDNNERTVAVYRHFEPAEMLLAFQDAANDVYPALALVDDNRSTFVVPLQRRYTATARIIDRVILLDRGKPGSNDGCWVSFDGISGALTVTDVSAIQNAFDAGGTVEATILPFALGEGAVAEIIAKDTSTSIWALSLIAGSTSDKGTLRFTYDWDGTNASWTAVDAINFNAVSSVAVAYDADAASNDPTFYVNGVAQTTTVGTQPTGTRITDAGDNLLIGNNGAGSSTFFGYIDEVRLWSDIRTATEISDNHNEHLHGLEAGLVGYWPMDSGTSVTVTDRSVNSNNATGVLTTAVTWVDNRAWQDILDFTFHAPHSGGADGYIEIPASYSSDNDGISDKIIRMIGRDLLSSVSADTDTFEINGEMLDLLANKTRQILSEQKASSVRSVAEKTKWREEALEFERRVNRDLNNGIGLGLVSRRTIEVPDA